MKILLTFLLFSFSFSLLSQEVGYRKGTDEDGNTVMSIGTQGLREVHDDFLEQRKEREAYFDSLIMAGKKREVYKITQPESERLKMCEERGHIMPDVVFKTAAYCQPYIVDTDSTTVKVYPSCNWIEYRCIRCGRMIKEKEKEVRVTLWRNDENK